MRATRARLPRKCHHLHGHVLPGAPWSVQWHPQRGDEHHAYRHAGLGHVFNGLHCRSKKALVTHPQALGHFHRFLVPVWHHAFHSLCAFIDFQRASSPGYSHHHHGLLPWRFQLQCVLLLAWWRHGPKVRLSICWLIKLFNFTMYICNTEDFVDPRNELCNISFKREVYGFKCSHVICKFTSLFA